MHGCLHEHAGPAQSLHFHLTSLLPCRMCVAVLQLNIEASLPRDPGATASSISSISGINFRVSPNSPISPLPEWGIYNRELWSIELSHDRVERERVTGADANAKVGGRLRVQCGAAYATAPSISCSPSHLP